MALSLSSLLSDPTARVVPIASITYFNTSSTLTTEWVGTSDWLDPIDGPVGTFIPGLLATPLSISESIDPLDPAESFGSLSQIELINDSTDHQYAGRYDSWHRHSIDDCSINIYLVGILGNGTRIELSHTLSTPFFSMRGIGIPEPSDNRCILNVRDDSHALDSPLQPETYSPPCLVFPGLLTTAGCVDLGDILNITGSVARSYWVYLDNPSLSTAQYIMFKDGGATGYYLAVGLVGGGTITGGVEFTVRGQTPATTTTAAGILRARTWHRIDISVDTAAGTRRIDVDGTTIITTSGITGTPLASTVPLYLGYGLLGRLSRAVLWSAARTNAVMSVEGRIPVLGTEATLVEYFPADEGVGVILHSRKSGSSVTGTIGASCVWGNSGWHYSGIAGQNRPLPIGNVLRAPVKWIDGPKQIGEVAYGGCSTISDITSNGTSVTVSNYTLNLPAGTFRITTGALNGTYAAQLCANNLWGSALLFSSASLALATITSPTGASPGPGRTLCIQHRPDTTSSLTNRYLIGWHVTTAAGAFFIRITTGGVNRVQAFIINDAAAQFNCTHDSLIEGVTYSIAARANPSSSAVAECPANTMQLLINGAVVSSVVISGVFTATQATLGVGCRSNSTLPCIGRIDEPLVFNRVLFTAEIQALHLLPATGLESGLTNAWHLDDGTGATTAAPFVGATSLTLTAPVWVGGRSAAADLGRWCYIRAGYLSTDLDPTTWRGCLDDNPSDCGWWVGAGESALTVTRTILAGLGFIVYKLSTTIYVRRFEGASGVAEVSYSGYVDVRTGEIEAEGADPAVWEWQVVYATNNVPIQFNTDPALATSNPEQFAYVQAPNKRATRSDYGIKKLADGSNGRFPKAIQKERVTALVYQKDAEDEAARLLALHRHSADVKSVPLWVLAGSVPILQEVEFEDVTELEMDLSTWVVIGLEIEDDEAGARVWRQAKQTY